MSEKKGGEKRKATAEQVAAFLRANPGFFVEHQELLAELTLPHESGGAVSLLERQVAVLRERGRRERARLDDLMDNARGNDRLFDTTRRVVLSLLEAGGLDGMREAALSALARHPGVDACELILTARPGLDASAAVRTDSTSELTARFRDAFRLGRTHCGAPDRRQLDWLFPDADGAIRSAALCPVTRDGEAMGLLALGSRDGGHFSVSHDTLFLDYIAEIFGAILARRLADAGAAAAGA